MGVERLRRKDIVQKVNREVIARVFKRLEKQVRHLSLGETRDIKMPVLLQDGSLSCAFTIFLDDSAREDCSSSKSQKFLFDLKTSIKFGSSIIAYREYSFYLLPAKEIVVRSYVFTSQGYEGLGLGSGLLLLTNEVMEMALRLFADEFHGCRIFFRIIDVARSETNGKKRDLWTSNWARTLSGFSESFGDIFTKRYR